MQLQTLKDLLEAVRRWKPTVDSDAGRIGYWLLCQLEHAHLWVVAVNVIGINLIAVGIAWIEANEGFFVIAQTRALENHHLQLL